MLLWIILILLPIALSIGFALRPRFPLTIWFVLIAVSALIEIMLVATSGHFPGPKQLAAASMLMIIVPWGLVALYLRFMRIPTRPVATSVGILFVYFSVFGIGVLSGALPSQIPQ
jgi:hypothetical protein